MSLVIGRVTLSDPTTWRSAGEVIRAEGFITESTTTAQTTIRQQLLGYNSNRDEPIIPITSTADDTIDGFYRVDRMRVDIDDGGHALRRYEWQAVLTRVTDYTSPVIESVMLAPTVRENDHSITVSAPFHGLPTAAVPHDGGFSTTTNASEDGNIIVYHEDSDDGGVRLIDGSIAYTLAPASWYNGACRFELDYDDDGTYRTVIGRQHENLAGDDRWRISNGIVRVVLNHASELQLGMSKWTGSAYSTAKDFFVGQVTGGGARAPFGVPHSITALRNGPDVVTVRLSLPFINTDLAIFVDLTIARGMPWIEVQVSDMFPSASTSGSYGIGVNTTEAGTALGALETGLDSAGIHANAADGDSLRYIVAAPWTLDRTNTTEGHIETAVDPKVDPPSFCIGLSEDDTNQPEQDALHYFAAQSETVRVVER